MLSVAERGPYKWHIIIIIIKYKYHWIYHYHKQKHFQHQSDEQKNCFKGNFGETFQRWGTAHMGFFKHIDTTLNCTVLPGTVLSWFLHKQTEMVSRSQTEDREKTEGKHNWATPKDS